MPASNSTAAGPNGYAVTVGTANQLAVGYSGSRQGLIFYNNSSAALIAVCPCNQFTIAQGTAPAAAGSTSLPTGSISAAATGVAVINGPGSFTLSPGQSFIIDTVQATTAWNCIASAAGAALTVTEHF